jgi:hypothetical protein
VSDDAATAATLFDLQPDLEEKVREDGICAELFTLQAAAYLGDGARGGLAEDDRAEGGVRSAR